MWKTIRIFFATISKLLYRFASMETTNITTVSQLVDFAKAEKARKINNMGFTNGFIGNTTFKADVNGVEMFLVITSYGSPSENKSSIYSNGFRAYFLKTVKNNTLLSKINISNVQI